MKIRRSVFTFLLLLCLTAVLPQLAFAQDARNISGEGAVAEYSGFHHIMDLFDGQKTISNVYQAGSWITFENEEGIGSVYIIFDRECFGYTVTNNDTGETGRWGENDFLHEFVDLEGYFGSAPTSVTLTFEEGPFYINEIELYSSGEVPASVQKWEKPLEEGADLVLFSTHADDEQLFFSGILPYYAGELGYRVQVVYLTNHRNLPKDPFLRCHEALNGLWSVGVTAYPQLGTFGDYYTRNIDDAYSIFHMMGVSDDQLLSYVVEQIRRFKPLVAVGHDFEGEYKHGEHMVYTDMLVKALEITNDPEQFPESAEKYGVWDVPKTYIHLYEENPIVMDWDQPLEHFDGMTAFQATKHLGWPCHVSQQLDFAWYTMGVERAIDVEKYNPCYYGLYRTTVGDDVEKKDFFEHLTTYDEQIRQAEEAARLEEEAARKAEEAMARMQEEEAARKEAELAAIRAEKQAQDAQQSKNNAWIKAIFSGTGLYLILGIGISALLVLTTCASVADRKKNN